MYRYVLSNKKQLSIYIIFLILSASFSVLFAFVLSSIMDSVVNTNQKRLVECAIGGCAVLLMAVGTEYCYGLAKNRIKKRIRTNIKADLFANIFAKTIMEYDKKESTYYVNQFIQNLDLLDGLYFSNLLDIPMVIYSFLLAVISCIIIEPIMLLIIVVLAISSALIVKGMTNRLKMRTQSLSENLTAYNGTIIWHLQAFRLIKTSGIEDEINKINKEQSVSAENAKEATANERKKFGCVNETVGLTVTLMIMAISGYFAIAGHFSVGIVLAFGQLSGKIISPIMSVTDMIANIKSAKSILEQYEEELGVNANLQKEYVDIEMPDIVLKGVSLTRGENIIIDDFSYVFEKGKKYLIEGENGTGKTSLIMMMLGQYQVDCGEILYNDISIQKLNSHSISQVVSYVGQEPLFLPDTLYNNLTLYRKYSDEQIEKVIELCGLTELLNRLPNHLQYDIKNGDVSFSGGEKQKICVARALLQDTPIMILDEISAHMDPESTLAIESIVVKLANKTIISVSHKIPREMKTYYDQIIKM